MIHKAFRKYRFWWILALLFATQVAIVGAFFFAIRVDLEPAQRALLDQLLAQRFPLVVLLSLLLLSAQGHALKTIMDRHLSPMARLAEEVELLISHPGHRIVPEGTREVRNLAKKINALATMHHELRGSVEARVTAAREAFAEERNRLAALMSELPQSVLVCNLEGTILLYNASARRLFGARHGDDASRAAVGLGRSLFGVIERELVIQALDQIRHRLRHSGNRGGAASGFISSFVTTLAEGRIVRARMAPVHDGGGALHGFVLTLDDMPRHSGMDDNAVAWHMEEIHAPAGHAAKVPERPEFYDFDLFGHIGRHASLDERLLAELSYTVFDTETTGLNPAGGDEIISIGALRIVNGRLLTQESFNQLVQPGIPVSAQSTAIHGIDNAMLKDSPGIEKVLPKFQRFAENTVLVAHNAAFDMKFLQMKEERTGIRFSQPVLDTLLLSKLLHPHQKDHSLDAIARRFGVAVVGRHSALGDTLMTAQVFLMMLPLLAEQGIFTLRQAMEAAQQTDYARLRY